MIFWGEKDWLPPLKHGYSASEKLSHARARFIEQGGHITFFASADDLNRFVVEFLSEQIGG